MYFYFIVIILLAGLDQWIKFWVRANLSSTSYIELIPNMIHLTYQENKGISFSYLADLPDGLRVPLLVGVSLVVIIGLIVYTIVRWRQLFRVEKWGHSLVLAGAIGNLGDRAFRQQVTDYMYFHYYDTGFFVNNLADDLISVGFVLILIPGFFYKKKEASEQS